MATEIIIKHTTSSTPPSNLKFGELGIAQDKIYFGNYESNNIEIVDTLSTQAISGTKYIDGDTIFYQPFTIQNSNSDLVLFTANDIGMRNVVLKMAPDTDGSGYNAEILLPKESGTLFIKPETPTEDSVIVINTEGSVSTEPLRDIDSTPIADSQNLITSGGTYAAISDALEEAKVYTDEHTNVVVYATSLPAADETSSSFVFITEE